ncbi:polyprenyl synthetase family protein [Oceanobacillus neutriphilus]|uniref:Farnesyl diphosphate synthase n=1 Tax=Oceanobacillus neutriphilus TaxID=531815 RepID=A0ABQ2P1U1_9BACI|nr:farnesyl diphosphate synthase [Oceanobacillus neutriphilus]GGP16026.1 farnesyl diphosphate synthase [Oceanobacillus neutriphilus]
MHKRLQAYLEFYREELQKAYTSCFDKLEIPANLKQSMLYSLDAGGKRLRPILLFASYEVYGQNVQKAMSSAIALEMIHTYSLIHDDLPAMDNDNYRRGMLTNHKKFDEATAILAGDALLTYSFELILSDSLLTSEEKVVLAKELAACSGPKGMVGGQILDMEAEKQSVSLEAMEEIHALKTGELIRFAIFAGAYLANATDEQLHYLKQYAYYLGLIFQVQDDILDVSGEEEKLGKPVGSDELNEKSTYPKLLGLDGAMEQKEKYVQKAYESLRSAGAEDSLLKALTDYFSQRDH